MAQDTGPFHGLPITGTIRYSGRYSPTDNGRPKQPQQQISPCTTQASPPTMPVDQAGALGGCRTPSNAPSPRRAETFVPEVIPRSARSPVVGPGTVQDGGAHASQHGLMLEAQIHKQEHYSDDIQHRIKDMWPSRPSESDECDPEYGIVQRRMSETASGHCSSRSAHISQNHSDYETLGSCPQDWIANSHSSFQQPLTWSALSLTTQSVHFQNRFDLMDQGQPIPTSSSYDSDMVHLDRSFDEINPDYVSLIPTTTSFKDYAASVDNVPNTSLSFYEVPSAVRHDREDTVPLSERDTGAEYKEDLWWRDQLLGSSRSSMEAPGGKVDEPYAQLIYRAFLSRPNKSMTLQEIYQWFRENTDKSKAEGKGWQNSIRHNLSMNGAFTKRNSKNPLSGNGDGSVSLDNAGTDGRKSTEWFLEPAFYAGVESTTRYRKGNSGSRSRGAGSHPGRSRLGSESHAGTGGGFSHARVSAGRKGGNVAAQNRKRLAERQQHAKQMEATTGHSRYPQPQGYHGQGAMAYGGFEDEAYYSRCPAPHLAPSPFPPGLGGVATVIGQGQCARQADMFYHSFDSDDVGRDVQTKRSRTLGTENDRNEPTTPPGSTLEPPRSADFGGKHREFLPEMTGSYNPLNSYQIGLGIEQQPQHHVYSFTDVTGVFEPPIGTHQPPIFVDQDTNLTQGDALLMNLNFGE